LSASAGAEEVAPPLALGLFGLSALAPPLALSLAGFSALALELELGLLGELALAPPDAEPGLAGALDAAELDEDFDGSVAALPPAEVEPDEEPDGDDGVALLALEEPGVFDDEVRSGPWSQAARPKASATDTARIESFMSPPWLGQEVKEQLARPD